MNRLKRTELVIEAGRMRYDERLRIKEIAKRLNVAYGTASRYVREFRGLEQRTGTALASTAGRDKIERKAEAKVAKTLVNYQENLRQKAVVAVEAGLDDPADSYKRGGLGVQVLKGLGDFAPDQGAVGVQFLIETCPPEWRDDFIRTPAVIDDSLSPTGLLPDLSPGNADPQLPTEGPSPQ